MTSTIYLANRLKKKDSVSGLDEWKLTTINNCEYTTTPSTRITNRTENRKTKVIVLIPFTGLYKRYGIWKSGTQGFYTISEGDFIFLDNPGTLTNDNIVDKCNDAGDRAFKVENFTVVRKRFGIRFEIKVTG